LDKLKRNKNIKHKHGKETYVIERFVTMYYGRELSQVCGYTQELDLTFYEKEILHFYVYWKTTLF
jgi:hypothetical protein